MPRLLFLIDCLCVGVGLICLSNQQLFAIVVHNGHFFVHNFLFIFLFTVWFPLVSFFVLSFFLLFISLFTVSLLFIGPLFLCSPYFFAQLSFASAVPLLLSSPLLRVSPARLPAVPKAAHDALPIAPTDARIREVEAQIRLRRRERTLLPALARTQPPRLRLFLRQQLVPIQQRHALRMAIRQMPQWAVHVQHLVGTSALHSLSLPTFR